MGVINTPLQQNKQKTRLAVSMILAFVAILTVAQALIAAGNGAQAAVINGTKTVNRSQVAPVITDTVQYTIVISNSGDVTATVAMTDALDTRLAYANGLDAQYLNGSGSASESSDVITWSGALQNGGVVTITFNATVTNTAVVGQFITNTAVISGAGSLITPTTSFEIVSPHQIYLPVIFKSPPKLTLQVSRPNSANQWAASWNSGGNGVTGYEIQESHDPLFGSLTATSPGNVGLVNSDSFAYALSTDNVYYYRVRAVAGTMVGPWSDVQQAISGFRDDFTDDTNGWVVRRMTNVAKSYAKLGTNNEAGNMIILLDDRWDWFIASPLAPAPSLPYAIEYRARVHDAANLVSGGMVFGGDWNGQPCPDPTNYFQTTNCFNHFYTFNYIWYGPIKLLYEQVDELLWCPDPCVGSDIKRLGPKYVIDNLIADGPSFDYHVYRVEVREDGARLYLDGNFIRHFTDTTWIHDPYYGAFASTDEYKPSIWLYDYFQVTPLD